MRLLAAVALLSAATLGFEVLLVRMFSIAQWHHFAYMIISLALLGFGASGTFLSFTRKRLLSRFPLAFAGSAALFGISVPAAFALSQTIPLNVLEIAWDPDQRLYLLLIYLILAIPFFCAATGIGLALAAVGENVGVVYRSDLIGAGFGALAVVGGLYVLPPGACLKAIGALGLSSAVLVSWHDKVPKALPTLLVLAAVAFISSWPAEWANPRTSPYKELSLALLAPDSEVVAERSSPLGLLTVVRSPTIPFHHAPGLSLMSDTEPPEQLAVFNDGGSMTAIARFDGQIETFRYLDEQTSALPFHLLNQPRVAVLGAGTGMDTLLARLHGSRSIDAVEINPQMIQLVRREFAQFAGDVYEDPAIDLHIAEARNFVAGTEKSFDLIQVALLDSFTAAAAGLHALNESTLYTVEAFDTYLNKLATNGFLAVTRWLRVPPRDNLKLFAIAVEALRRRGVVEPSGQLILIHGWQTATLLIKNGLLTRDEISTIREFCRERAFDVAYYSGMDRAEANRYSVFDRPYLFDGAVALLGPNAEQFLSNYGFDISPSTDDRPYFFHFLKWRTLAELIRMPRRSGFNLIEWGYPVLLVTLAQAIVASTILILLPLVTWRVLANRPEVRHRGRLRVAVYFFALGLAFLFIEIAFIQRFQLFLGHPLHAVSVVLCGFLVFAGLGSGCAKQCAILLGGNAATAVVVAIAAIAVIALTYIGVLPWVFAAFDGLPPFAKIGISLALIAPLAFFMGMPFPLGLADTAVGAPELVPWAWAINGCASVLSAVLATLLAIHFGFSSVIFQALVLYGMAAVVFPAAKRLMSPDQVDQSS